MSIIRIGDFGTLDIEAIRSYNSSEREMPKKPDENVVARETVLTNTKYDGEDVTLTNVLAEAALSILRQHGCYFHTVNRRQYRRPKGRVR